MDLFRPSFDLEEFKASDYGITKSALQGAMMLGMDDTDIDAAVASMKQEHFYKSMTSYKDSKIWQDVYHVPYEGKVLYVKFTKEAISEFTLLSFKEK